ncbi:branched-chain amino acid ABC transporter permease [Caenispirillum salinarum]|uniref:branched-chain amino acid ABC transporter permease n=1 Tax=Caenispirillum salinarum TaxID=859058 RepID=UPI00384D19C8
MRPDSPTLRRRLIRDGLPMLLLAVAPLAAMAVDAGWLVPVFTRMAVFALAAMALHFILSIGGMVSLGHAAFFAIGGYVVGIGSQHAYDETPAPFGLPGWNDMLISLPAAFVVGALIAVPFGWVSLRTRGAYFIMITLALAQMVFYLLVSLRAYGGEDGISMWWGRNTVAGLEMSDRLALHAVCLVILALAWWVLTRMTTAPFGRVLDGARQNEGRMKALGYRPLAYQIGAFALSGGIVAVAGALMANVDEFVSPGLGHWTVSGELLVIVILGGLGSLSGAVWGAVVLLGLEEILMEFTQHWAVILGPLLVVIVLFARGGVGGFLDRLNMGKRHDADA